MTYRYVNIALEGLSFLICLVLLLHQITEKKTRNKSHSWFSAMLLSNMLMLLGDMFDWILGGTPGPVSYYVQYFFCVILYFSVSGFLLFSLYGWIISYIKQKTSISPVWLRVGIVLSVIQTIIAVTAPLHKMCYINQDNYYSRGSLFWISQICPYAMYFLAMFLLLRYRKSFKKRELGYLGFFVTIPLIAEIIQVATYKYTTLGVTVSVGLIVVFAFILSEREVESEQILKELAVNENKKLEEMQFLQENLSNQLIDVLCSTVEAKDQYTKGHSLRVAQYAREIMYRLGGDEKEQQEVYYIGVLHDVGKISIKDEIINKKGKLTQEEYEQIKLHTVAGYQILHDVDVIPNLAVGARWHHERFDGTGYPNGLAGENIPLVARIISVADAYDAMTSNRSYHSIMPQSKVRSEIENGMGTQFDPKIAQIMLDMIDEDMQYNMKQSNYNKAVNILLIDDDLVMHKMVQRALMDENCILDDAQSGQEGIDLLKESKYDICLLDMKMPGMSGLEVLAWIQKNIRKMKVIILTGDKELDIIRKSEELGARDYITKPINPLILRESIRSILRQ